MSFAGLERTVAAIVERDVVIATGPEALAYLHGQISADVEALGVGDSTLSFLLEPRGRVEVLFGICRSGPETFVLDTEPGFGDALAASLNRFKLRTRVEFTMQSWPMLALRGPIGVQEELFNRLGTASSDRVVRSAGWPLAAGADVLACDRESLTQSEAQAPLSGSAAPVDSDAPVARPLSSVLGDVEMVDSDEFRALRLAYGLPVMGEIRPGDIPNETGLVALAASFTKGCYRGQELVERIDSRSGGRRMVRRCSTTVALQAADELTGSDGATIATVLGAASLDVGDNAVAADVPERHVGPDGRAGTAAVVVGFALARSEATEASLDGVTVHLADV